MQISNTVAGKSQNIFETIYKIFTFSLSPTTAFDWYAFRIRDTILNYV